MMPAKPPCVQCPQPGLDCLDYPASSRGLDSSPAAHPQAIIDAVYLRGEPTLAISRGVPAWCPIIERLGEGATYYQYDSKAARRLLADAGFPNGFKTQVTTTGGLAPDLLDAVQLAQHDLTRTWALTRH